MTNVSSKVHAITKTALINELARRVSLGHDEATDFALVTTITSLGLPFTHEDIADMLNGVASQVTLEKTV